MFKAWTIGTDIYDAYLANILEKENIWGNAIIIKNQSVFIQDQEIYSGSNTTIGQIMRVFDFLGLLSKERKPTKVNMYYNNEIRFSFIEKPDVLKEHIKKHILARSKILFESQDYNLIENEFYCNEDAFIFSIIATFIKIDNQKNIRFIEMQLENTKVEDFSSYYENLTIYLGNEGQTSTALFALANKHLIGAKEEVPKILTTSNVPLKDNVEDMHMPNNLDGVLQFDKYDLGLFIKSHMKIKSKIKIPIYQRKYRWGEDIVLQLLKDIKNIKKDHMYIHHNIGILVTKNQANGNNIIMKIIDGQQRLTTMMLIFRAVYDYAVFKKWKIAAIAYDRFVNKTKNGIFENDISNAFLRIKGNDDYSSFKELMRGHNAKTKSSSSIIYKNYYHILNWLVANIRVEKELRYFWKSLINKTIFSTMTDRSASEYELFEKLNTLSIPLKVFELIKNKILNDFNNIVDQNESQFQSLFQNMILKNFELKNKLDDKKIKNFLINILRIYNYSYSKDTSLFKGYSEIIEQIYKPQIENFDHDNYESFTKLLEIMFQDIALYNEITLYEHFRHKSSKLYPFADYLYTLLGRTIYVPILFKLLKEYYASDMTSITQNKVRDILNIVETYEMRFQIVSYRGQSLSEPMNKIAKNISININLEILKKIFNDNLKNTLKIPNDDNFKNQIKSFKFSNALANIFLTRVENYVFHSGNHIEKDPEIKIVNIPKISREHIMTQNPKKWVSHISNIESLSVAEVYEKYDDYVDQIGNAIPIKAWKNSELGANDITSKLERYHKSSAIKELYSFKGFNLKNINLKPIDAKFSFKEIINRTNEFAKMALLIWKW